MNQIAEPVLSIQALSKYFHFKKPALSTESKEPVEDGFWALKDISFDLLPGEILGVIGKNGAGKSTLLKILAGIIKPTKGKVIIRGKTAGIFEVGTGFHPDLSGRENIFFYGALLSIEKSYLKKSIEKIIDFSGIRAFIDMPVKYYSTGMYLRLAASVTFHIQTDLLLLDEILFVGDLEFKLKCMEKVQAMISSGTTVILASHNTNDIIQFCTKCVLIEHGIISAMDSPGRVITKYIGSSLYPESDNTTITDSKPLKPSFSRWDDVSKAPAGELIRLREISVFAAGKEIHTPITTADNIEIQITFEKLISGSTAQLHIVFFDQLGNPIFSTDTFSVNNASNISTLYKDDTGLFVMRCTIPSNFLYKGSYTFQLRFGKNMKEEDLIYNSEIQFLIQATEGKLDYIGDALPLAIRPVLNWQYEKTAI